MNDIFSTSKIVKLEIEAKQEKEIILKTTHKSKYISVYFIFFKCLVVFLAIPEKWKKLVLCERGFDTMALCARF